MVRGLFLSLPQTASGDRLAHKLVQHLSRPFFNRVKTVEERAVQVLSLARVKHRMHQVGRGRVEFEIKPLCVFVCAGGEPSDDTVKMETALHTAKEEGCHRLLPGCSLFPAEQVSVLSEGKRYGVVSPPVLPPSPLQAQGSEPVSPVVLFPVVVEHRTCQP